MVIVIKVKGCTVIDFMPLSNNTVACGVINTTKNEKHVIYYMLNYLIKYQIFLSFRTVLDGKLRFIKHPKF